MYESKISYSNLCKSKETFNYNCDVSHPSYYQSSNGLEVIDVIRAFTENLEGIEAVDTANILKYVCRYSKKNGIQDLEKAMWYLQDLIDILKKKESSSNE